MSLEGQPNTILTEYSPFAWVQELTATNTGTFINYPTAQNGPITFPNTITANKVESSSITTIDNAPLSIGTFVGRTRAINIGTGMSAGIISLGGAATTVKANIIQSDSTLEIQNSDGLGIGAVSIGVGETRTGNINIGSNTVNSIGLSTGSVNIMCGTGRQEGSFNVLTDASNRGVINLGSTGSNEGGINIYAKFSTGIKIAWGVATYSGVDTFLGGYKEGTYSSVATLSINLGQQRIVGSIPSLLSVGLYQVNVNSTLASSLLDPYLVFQVYTKPAAVWINGALRGGSEGTGIASFLKLNRNPTTAVTELYTLSMSGLLTISTKAYVAVVVGNGDITIPLHNLTFISTYLSVTRVG